MAGDKLQTLAETLHPLERKVLPTLLKQVTVQDIVQASGLQEVEVIRALQWLENKGILKIEKTVLTLISLDKEGKKYVHDGLPEQEILKILTDKPMPIGKAMKEAGLSQTELHASIGILKRKLLADLSEGQLTITKHGATQRKKAYPEQEFLQLLAKEDQDKEKLRPEQLHAVGELLKRKGIICQKKVPKRAIELTDLGKKLAKVKLAKNVVDSLTPDMLKDGSWKGKTFRRYDVMINVPKISGGRRHFVKSVIRYIKRIWLDLGFTEMEGNIIQTSFWNMDALFIPQDHPARTMQDTYYIANPEKGRLPPVAKKVQAVHEHGGDTGSTGWQAPWDKEMAKENTLRTHTTPLSAQTIAKLKESDLPAKFFSVGRVYRNEALDWSHLFEFNQVEGIVIDPNANFRHLLGYLREFYKKMGYPEVRARPAFFPYTFCSLEIDVFDPVHKKWIELGGAGIFRPEVVKPLLGIDVPVLAWGQGLGRIISSYFDITDIRDLYKNDLKQLRTMKEWME